VGETEDLGDSRGDGRPEDADEAGDAPGVCGGSDERLLKLEPEVVLEAVEKTGGCHMG